MNNKLNIMRVAFSFVFAMCVLFNPLVSHAEYGTSSLFNGNLRVYTPDVVSYIDCVQVDTETFTYEDGAGVIYDDYQKVKYAGTISGFLEINGMTEGHVLQGHLFNLYKLSLQTIDGYTYSPMQVDFNFQYGDSDVVFSTALLERGAGYYNSHIRADLNNYFCDKDVTRFPFTVNVEFTILCPPNHAPNPYYRVSYVGEFDTTGICYEYTDLRDVPSIEGNQANQNQQIIDGVGEIIENQQDTNDHLEYIYNENININSNITAQGDNIVDSVNNMNTSIVNKITTSFADLKTNLSTWFTNLNNKIDNRFDRLTNDLSNWFFQLGDTIGKGFTNLMNQNNTQHQETINGYQGNSISKEQQEFDEKMGIIEDYQDNVMYESIYAFDDFAEKSFDLTPIESIANSLFYVTSWFTNFWEMGGMFTSFLNFCLAVFIASFVLRVRGR